MKQKVVVEHLYKIFGDRPEEALALLKQGVAKDEVFERTGNIAGVYDANLEIGAGEIFVIMGLSGSGKSTLVRMLNRLIEPTSGHVFFDGVDIAAMNDADLLALRRKKISMVFQSFALMPHLNVLENTSFGLDLAGVEKEEREARALEALDQVGLRTYAASYPDELSGGMQQRVGLARALAGDPEVLLMDEAFSALDPLIRTEMQDELLDLQSRQQRTIIFISHDLDEAMRIGDRIAIMEGGRVVQVGTPEEILRNPADDYVKSFFRGVDVTSVLSAGDIARKVQTTVIEREGVGIRAALQRLKDHDAEHGYLVGKDGVYHGVVSLASLSKAASGSGSIRDAVITDIPFIPHDTALGSVLGVVAEAPCAVPVVDDKGRYRGTINKTMLLQTIDRESGTEISERVEEMAK
ncbi:glycine betaine/L-proline ABC transporter ATP-binding protein ProV [Mangrovitalea sediminis]|uniref:glycine betaine/L-proline ABC transporter ATP-binding protein ProV n=1 Tax=Mangrovitalea sediminis TaxID=1982043 RepID=UPI000BE4D59B|nr:glycine betaine/L-proline ABC transporter ATP-binding protein ProV [Mangrovitalea sediminis]